MTTEAPAPGGFWRRRVADGVRGVAEALFPANDLGAPSWREADLVARTLAWLDALPPESRRLVSALFAAVELVGPVLVPGLRRFSRLPVARREAALRRWRASRLYPLRFVGDSLKAAVTMVWLSHPAALAYVGERGVCGVADAPAREALLAADPRSTP